MVIPLNELVARASELDSARDIVVHCKTGGRSAQAIGELQQLGFRKLRNLKGGILAWAEKSIPPYRPTESQDAPRTIQPGFRANAVALASTPVTGKIDSNWGGGPSLAD